jgi:hypothetical protein
MKLRNKYNYPSLFIPPYALGVLRTNGLDGITPI